MKLIPKKLFCLRKTQLFLVHRKHWTIKNQENVLHKPVMLNEVLKFLVDDKECENFKLYVDMTFGAGGHTSAILEKNPKSIVYALDRDVEAFELAKKLALKYPLFPMNAKFSDIDTKLSELGVQENSIDAALIDCGVSSIQFDTPERGFSVSHDSPLDMRMGCNVENVTAADIVNKLDEESLGRIIWKYGEERLYKKIAHGIVYFRNDHGPIKTTKQLADIISTIVKQNRTDSICRPAHVATKTFQALRIFVNNELNELFNGIELLHKYLRPGVGRLAVLSFHSLEDRIVKNHFSDVDVANSTDSDALTKDEEKRKRAFKMNKVINDLEIFSTYVRKQWAPINKKVLVPTNEEIELNPRSRSAKLRVAIKI